MEHARVPVGASRTPSYRVVVGAGAVQRCGIEHATLQSIFCLALCRVVGIGVVATHKRRCLYDTRSIETERCILH